MSAKVNLDMTGDERKVLASLSKLEAKVKSLEGGVTSAAGKMKSKFDATGDSIEKAGKKSKSAFGAQAVAGLTNYLGAAVGIGTAIGVITKGLREADQIRKEAAQGLKAGFGAVGRLAQLSGGDAGVLAADLSAVRGLRTEFGFGKEGAANLRFQLKSFGLLADQPLFAGLRGQVDSPGQIAEGVGTLQSAFGANAGTSRQILNKLFAASAVSKTTVGQFAPAATIAAQTVQPIGGTASELLGTLSIVAKAAKSAEVGATQISALADVIGKKGFGGRGLIAGVESISQATAGLSNEEFIEFFGRKEARKGFGAIIRNLPEILETIRTVEEEGGRPAGRGLTSRNRAAFMAQRELAGVFRLQVETQRRQVAEEMDLGGGAIGRETAREGVRRRTRNVDGATGFVTRFAARKSEEIGADPEMITRVGRQATGTSSAGFDRAVGQLLLPLVQLVDGITELVTTTREQGKGPTLIPAQAEAPPATSRLQD